jgi:GT2 family glycosyltransferase
VDLGFRLRLLGHECRYVPDAVVRHIGSALSGVGSDFSVYHGHRNLVWTYVKNMPPALFWLYLPQHLCLNVMSLVWFALRGQGGVILRAKHDAVRALPRVWRQRAVVMRQRRVTAGRLRAVMARGLLAPYAARASRQLPQ